MDTISGFRFIKPLTQSKLFEYTPKKISKHDIGYRNQRSNMKYTPRKTHFSRRQMSATREKFHKTRQNLVDQRVRIQLMSSQVLTRSDVCVKSDYNNMSNFDIKKLVVKNNSALKKLKFPRTNDWDDVNKKNSKYSEIMLTKRVVSRQERFLRRLIKRRRVEQNAEFDKTRSKKRKILAKVKKRVINWDKRNREVETMPVIKRPFSVANKSSIQSYKVNMETERDSYTNLMDTSNNQNMSRSLDKFTNHSLMESIENISEIESKRVKFGYNIPTSRSLEAGKYGLGMEVTISGLKTSIKTPKKTKTARVKTKSDLEQDKEKRNRWLSGRVAKGSHITIMSGREENIINNLSLSKVLIGDKNKEIHEFNHLEMGSDISNNQDLIFNSTQMRSIANGILQTNHQFLKNRRIRQKNHQHSEADIRNSKYKHLKNQYLINLILEKKPIYTPKKPQVYPLERKLRSRSMEHELQEAELFRKNQKLLDISLENQTTELSNVVAEQPELDRLIKKSKLYVDPLDRERSHLFNHNSSYIQKQKLHAILQNKFLNKLYNRSQVLKNYVKKSARDSMMSSMVHRFIPSQDVGIAENESYLLAKEEDPLKYQEFSKERNDTFRELDQLDKMVESSRRRNKGQQMKGMNGNRFEKEYLSRKSV